MDQRSPRALVSIVGADPADEVDRIIFDKTGTLTLPELDVVNSASVPRDVFDLAGRLAAVPLAATGVTESGETGQRESRP